MAAKERMKGLQESEFVPFKRFCKDVGISTSLVTSQFPDLKVAYDERYRAFRTAQRVQRLQRFDAEVRVTVLLLRGRNEFPSVGRVVAENHSLRAGGWNRLQDAIRSTLNSG